MQRLLLLCFVASVARADFVLHWSDEFNGNSLDTSKWKYETGCSGWGNNELECYTANRPENVRVENGHLVIDVRVEDWEGHHFTSARLNSLEAWGYGKFEIRARMPSGHHLWPAIWMLPRNEKYGAWAASGEIDILELRGDQPHQIMGTIHYGGTWPNNKYTGSGERSYPADFSDDYHTFAVDWSPNKIIWYVDGQQYYEENINRMMWSGRGNNPYNANIQPFDDNPFFILLNVAVGGNFFGGGPYVTPDEARGWKKHTMEVDYVRVYKWQ